MNQGEPKKKQSDRINLHSSNPTLRDPILIEQVSSLRGEGGSRLEHAGDKGQSPQEQPSEVSAHE